MARQVHLTFAGPGYYSLPDIDADVIRESKSQIVLVHPALGSKPVKFSLANGFPLGTTRVRGIGRTGYRLSVEETARYQKQRRS